MARQVLDGIRVVDLSHSWAAPHATRVLADYGAEVIRIESPTRLCALRGATTTSGHYDTHPMWFQVNRGKRSVTLELPEPHDREVILDLVRRSDVVVENARGGVMERYGFTYPDLVAVKPDVILLSMASFGRTGPWAAFAGYGGTTEVVSGLQTLTAYAPGDRPRRIKEVDILNGVAGAGAVMTALVHRRRTGRGQWIDLSHLEAVSHALLGEPLLEFAATGVARGPRGNRHPRFAPQGCYRCDGVDDWVVLSIRSDEEWGRFCDVLQRPEWQADPRFATAAARQRHHDELDAAIGEWTAARSSRDVMDVLQKSGLAAGAVLDMPGLARDPHLAAREYYQKPARGRPALYPGLPIRLSATPGALTTRGPNLGEHNRAVVCDLLGRPASDIRPVDEDTLGTAFDPR